MWLGWSLPLAVLVIGIVTLIYSLLGGIRTIVWIDSFQFILYLFGGLVTIFYILTNTDGRRADLRDNAAQGRGRLVTPDPQLGTPSSGLLCLLPLSSCGRF